MNNHKGPKACTLDGVIQPVDQVHGDSVPEVVEPVHTETDAEPSA